MNGRGERGQPTAGDEAGDDPGGSGPLLRVAWKVVAALAVFGALLLGVGLALPGTWTAERSMVLAAPPDSVFAWLDTPARWDRWTALGTVETAPDGPARGEGAGLTWDDPFMGDGVFRITSSRPSTALTYRVEVEGGSLVTRGEFLLEPTEGGGTRITWTERGDFGWNPMMGYAALGMERVQGAELGRGLDRLKGLVEGGGEPAADDSAGPTTPRPSSPG